MKQTNSYNSHKHRLRIKAQNKQETIKCMPTYHHSSIRHKTTNYYTNSRPSQLLKNMNSNKIIKQRQSPRYKVVISSRSLSYKQTPRNRTQSKDLADKNIKQIDKSVQIRSNYSQLHSKAVVKHSWKEILEQQKNFMKKIEHLKSQRDSKLSYQTKKRISYGNKTPPKIKSIEKSKIQIIQLKSRPLQTYKSFIKTKGQLQYVIGFNFSYLRNLSRQQIEKYIDFSEFGIIESLQFCCLDVLQSMEQRVIQADNNLLREYCVLYFKQFQKNLIELVMFHHYFKEYQHYLYMLFLNQRIYFYALHEISLQYLSFNNQYLSLLIRILKRIIFIQKLILNTRKQLLTEEKSQINRTLRLNKMNNQLEKTMPTFQQEVKLFIDKVRNVGKIKNFIQELPKQSYEIIPQNIFQSLIQSQSCLSWNFLTIPPIPHLPSPKKRFTIVLGVQDVIAHYDQSSKYLILRPYIQYFFHKLQDQFEIVGFSRYQKMIADPIIDGIQKNQCNFDYRLYKQHLSLKNGNLVKDITKLGRQTQSILLIDTQQNGIDICKISKFVGNKKDKSLMTLADRLKIFIRQSSSDISTMTSMFCSLEDIMQENEEHNSLTVDGKRSRLKQFI